MAEGWGWPGLAKKAHYFVNSRALCGKWMFMGECRIPGPGVPATSPDDCKECTRRLAKRKESKK